MKVILIKFHYCLLKKKKKKIQEELSMGLFFNHKASSMEEFSIKKNEEILQVDETKSRNSKTNAAKDVNVNYWKKRHENAKLPFSLCMPCFKTAAMQLWQ